MWRYSFTSKAWWGLEGSGGFKRRTYIWYTGFPWCCGLCRTTALFKPFVMQTVLICASVHPQPVSALWSHSVLSPSYQRVPLFYMELVFSLYSRSLSRSLRHWVMPDSGIKTLRSSVYANMHILQYFQNSLFSVVWPTRSVEFCAFRIVRAHLERLCFSSLQ